MNYDKIINSVYDWINLEEVYWFLTFFWLSLPVLAVIPQALAKDFFTPDFLWVVYTLYDIMYVAVILGLVALTQNCLIKRKLHAQKITLLKALDTLFLVLLEFWHIFVWNMNRRLRVIQILLLMAFPLLYYYWTFDDSLLISSLLSFFVWAYVTVVSYNAVRYCFSIMCFYHDCNTIQDAVKRSWELTHHRFVEVITGVVLSLGAAFVLFAVVSVVLGALANVVLLYFFNPPLAYSIASNSAMLFALAPALIGYHYAITMMYHQLLDEKDSDKKIKKYLAKKVLFSEPRRLFKKHAEKRKAAAKTTKKPKKKSRR
ncbi:MAG: glycerophosphoryl diester phosphodiesterase membrane domain-containing protein [archaeon]